jgi:hypothetical protein
MHRQGDLVVRAGTAHPFQPVLEGADGLFGGAAKLGFVFPFHHRAGLQHVGQGRRDVADLVARRLLVPGEDAFVDQGARGFGQGERGGEEVGDRFRPAREAQKPVGADAKRAGAVGRKLGVRHPGAVLQKGRDRRTVDAGLPGKFRLADFPRRHRLGQTGAELGSAVAFVDFFHHSMIFQNGCGVKFTISRIPASRRICYRHRNVTRIPGPILQTETRAIEWPTLIVFAATYSLWAVATTWLWTFSPPLAVLAAALAIGQYSSLTHEVLHGHPFRSQTLSEALVFPGLTVFVPYLRFKDLHLQHHFDPALTDPYDDPESNYLDPAVWARLPAPVKALLRFNNTLFGRMLVGPAISTWALAKGDLAAMRKGDRRVWLAWGCICRGWRWSGPGWNGWARCRAGPICWRPTWAGAC